MGQGKATKRTLWSDESGQGLAEYVLIIALVAIALTAVFVLFRNSIGGTVDTIQQTLSNAPNGCKNPVPAVKNPNCTT